MIWIVLRLVVPMVCRVPLAVPLAIIVFASWLILPPPIFDRMWLRRRWLCRFWIHRKRVIPNVPIYSFDVPLPMYCTRCEPEVGARAMARGCAANTTEAA